MYTIIYCSTVMYSIYIFILYILSFRQNMVPCIPHPQKKTDLKDTDHCRLTFCVPNFGSRRFLGNQEEQLAKESEAKERHHLELAEDWAGRTRGAHVGVEGLWLP